MVPPSSLPPPLWVEAKVGLTTRANVARFDPRGQGGRGGGGRPRPRLEWEFASGGSNNVGVVTTPVPVRSSREPPPPRPPCPRPGGGRTDTTDQTNDYAKHFRPPGQGRGERARKADAFEVVSGSAFETIDTARRLMDRWLSRRCVHQKNFSDSACASASIDSESPTPLWVTTSTHRPGNLVSHHSAGY